MRYFPRKTLILLLAAYFFLPGGNIPECKAMDPVTIAILAPIALKAAQIALPYVLRGAQCTGRQFIKIGLDVVDVLRLPVGFIQCTVGAPLGYFDNGLANGCKGLMAPLKLCWDTCLIPVAMTGIAPP